MDDLGFKALIQATTFSSGGILSAEQGNAFVDMAVDQQVILRDCNVMRMTNNEEEINILNFGSRTMRKHSPGVAGASSTITSLKRSVILTEGKLWLELDIRTLRRLTVESDGKDVEGKLMSHIMTMAGTEFGNDIEDLALNGDTADSGADKDFLNITDGWIKKAKDDATTFDTDGSQDYKDVVFPGMIDSLPNKYQKNPAGLVLYCSPTDRRGYIRQIAGLDNSAALPYLTGAMDPDYEGVKVTGVPKMPEGTYILTFPKNLAFGIDTRGIERDFDKRVVERVIDAVIIAPIGFNFAWADALILGYDEA